MQAISIVDAHNELNRRAAKKSAKLVKEPPPPVDSGVSLYGCGLLDLLIALDRTAKDHLLKLDVLPVLRQIKKYFPFCTGSFKYARRTMSRLTVPDDEDIKWRRSRSPSPPPISSLVMRSSLPPNTTRSSTPSSKKEQLYLDDG